MKDEAQMTAPADNEYREQRLANMEKLQEIVVAAGQQEEYNDRCEREHDGC